MVPSFPTTHPSHSWKSWQTPYPQSITPQQVLAWIKEYPTPFFVYDLSLLLKRITEVKNFPRPPSIQFTPRYAIKANPNRTLINILDQSGIHFDASSQYEVERLLWYGIDGKKIMLTAQQKPTPKKFQEFIQQGMLYNAASLHQLENYGKLFPATSVSLRINPGIGSGVHKKTIVGGRESGFGIWHEQISQIQTLVKEHQLQVNQIHTHIGSGADPQVWKEVVRLTLGLVDRFSTVKSINIGGGFKVARHKGEKTSNLERIGREVKKQLLNYFQRTGRKLDLEIEPGTYYVGESGLLIAQIEDIIETGKKQKNHFLKLNCGMNDLIRPTLYNSHHHIDVVSLKNSSSKRDYTIIGHCCESGDVFSVGDLGINFPKNTRRLSVPQIGDGVIIHGCGAYGSSMSSHYNSFPLAAEFLYIPDGKKMKQMKVKNKKITWNSLKKTKLLCIRSQETIQEVVNKELENRLQLDCL